MNVHQGLLSLKISTSTRNVALVKSEELVEIGEMNWTKLLKKRLPLKLL
jgi:hypothetical protein